MEGKVQHELDELLTQRIVAIACGYEDANDAARRGSIQEICFRATPKWEG